MLRDNRKTVHYVSGRRNSVSTQANLCLSEATTYESEDEASSRRKTRQSTPLYSKQDIREQYCISDKQVHVLETAKQPPSLFGCISSRNVPTCSPHAPANLLSVCVKRKMSSDENLYELSRRPQADYAPFPRWRTPYPSPFVVHPHCPYRDQLYYLRQYNPFYYDWLPEEDEPSRMDINRRHPIEYDSNHGYFPQRRLPFSNYNVEPHIMTRNPSCPAHQNLPPPPPLPPPLPPPPPPPPPTSLPPSTPKPRHVSFAKSHTLTSFDDSVTSISSTPGANCSHERLLDGKKVIGEQPKEAPKSVVMEKLKKATMKTQATQTEVCLGRKPLPPNYLSLSPRTAHRFELQSAQTNGDRNFNRKLTKSYSELCPSIDKTRRLLDENEKDKIEKHEPLLRSQSEEPPKNAFFFTSPKKYNGEILINFEPLPPPNKKPLLKTCSDGEIIHRRNMERDERESTVSDCEICYQNISDDEEPSDKSSHTSTKPSSNKQLSNSESLEEEFHENLIYDRLYRQHSASSGDSLDCKTDQLNESQHFKKSLSVSNDSLDTRDHSDGMWNESVTTVLPIDSDNNGVGTCLSCSDISSPITPNPRSTSSKRKLLLLQHQQRSSIDTEGIDADDGDSKWIHSSAPDNEDSNKIQSVPQKEKSECKKDDGVVPSKPMHNLPDLFASSINAVKRHSPDGTSESNNKEKQSSYPHEVPESLSRTDSGRMNPNDMSETSTTDGYITATDSMSGVTTTAQGISHTTSSFDSVSSHFSLNKTDTLEELQQVPHSPLLENFKEIEPEKSLDFESASGRSSSCGSYSIEEQNKVETSRSTSAASSMEDLNTKGTKKMNMNDQMYRLETKDTQQSGGKKSDDDQLKRDLSADSGYRTIRRTKSNAYSSQNSSKVIMGNGMICHGGPIESSDDTSDSCSCGRTRRASPRCKIIENRSPTTFPRAKKRAATSEETLRRRSVPGKSPSSNAIDKISCVVKSPTSPGYCVSKLNAESADKSNNLKAASAESLRSGSPGSDSVFYSEHSSTTMEHSISNHLFKDAHSKQCSTLLKNDYSSSHTENIVKPPAGFEDSPRPCQRATNGKVFKKQEKRYRSEERWMSKTYNTRAKSEERLKETRDISNRPLTRSTDVSLEQLGTSSSIGSDDDDWIGIYADTYLSFSWIYITDADDALPWCHWTNEDDTMQNYQHKQKTFCDITDSENEFHTKYEVVINNIVHRRMSLELQKCLTRKSFRNIRRVVVCRDSSEYGFRIRGSRPVIVSVVESASPAAYAGLEVGDVILYINNYNVLNASHSDVLKIFQDCTDSLELEVVRTKDILSTSTKSQENRCIKRGYMWRQTINKQYTSSWMLRFFRLKEDHCLYCYKNEFESIPLGATNVTKYTVQKLINFTRPNTFLITRKEGKTIYLSTESTNECESWISLISNTAKYPEADDICSEKLLVVSVNSIADYEYRGFLSSLVHHNGNHWKRQFCVLKEARLYCFADMNASQAIGIIYLHGYKVQSTSSASRRHAFELIPLDGAFKHFLFYTETSIDKRRWMAAMEETIGRLIKIF